MARHHVVLSTVMIPVFDALCCPPCVMPTIVPALEEAPQHATYNTDGKVEKISVDTELLATAPAHDTYEVVATSPVDTAFVVCEQHKRFRELDFRALRRLDSTGNSVMCSEQEISDFLKNRRRIVGMMIERGYAWRMQRHTLMIAVDILDRYLAHNPFRPRDMMYVGMVSLVIAAKMEESRDVNWLLRAMEDLSEVTDDVPDLQKHIIRMERQILYALDYNVSQPTYMTFLGLILLDDEKPCVVFLTCFLLELSLFEEGFRQFPPLMICASCILVARKYQGRLDWPHVLRDRTLHTNALGVDAVYSVMDLATTTQMVVDMRRCSDNTLWVHTKYSSEKYGSVADVSI